MAIAFFFRDSEAKATSWFTKTNMLYRESGKATCPIFCSLGQFRSISTRYGRAARIFEAISSIFVPILYNSNYGGYFREIGAKCRWPYRAIYESCSRLLRISEVGGRDWPPYAFQRQGGDRKSTRLNSSHVT